MHLLNTSSTWPPTLTFRHICFIAKVSSIKKVDLDEKGAPHKFWYKKQIEIINKLYLNENVEHQDLIVREISNKQKGYQKQDVEKKILNKDKLINYDQIIELLVVKKLKCYYCDGNCSLLYKKVLERKQWTLDRINNDLGHNYDNIVLCCLDCNIKRGNMNSERFKSGKTIKIVKKEF